MARNRVRVIALALLALALLPPSLWLAVVIVAPTEWAKRQIISAFETRTGRLVRLGALKVQLTGGVRVANLEIGSPQSTGDPWLRADALRLDIGLPQLLVGQFETSSIEIDGLDLRVLRRADGSFELADLMPRDTERSEHSRQRRTMQPIHFKVRGGTVSVLDEPSQTRVIVQNVEADGIRADRRIAVSSLRGLTNGGTIEFAGELVHQDGAWSAAAVCDANDVVIDDGMSLLRYAVPVLAGASLNLKGQLDSQIRLQGAGETWDELVRSLTGQGVITLDPVDVAGAPLVAELSKVAEISRQGHVASIRSDFVISGRRVATSQCTLNIGKVPVTLAGWTDFDGNIDYRVNLTGLSNRLPEKARRVLGDLKLDLSGLTDLTLQGTVNKMAVRVHGVSLDRDLLREQGISFKKEDREKLRVLGRQLLDQISR
jgi:AsmA-like C-terminal region